MGKRCFSPHVVRVGANLRRSLFGPSRFIPIQGAWVMAGEVIQFVRQRDFKRGLLYRQQLVPRGPAPAPGVGNTSIVELRVARIARLLTELEDLTRLPKNVSPTTL